eukprot:RCo016806
MPPSSSSWRGRDQPRYYADLNLTDGAPVEEVKRQYRVLAMKYHPDKNGSKEAHEKMAKINAAYAVLSDAKKKAEYDTQFCARPFVAFSRRAAGECFVFRPTAPPPQPHHHTHSRRSH